MRAYGASYLAVRQIKNGMEIQVVCGYGWTAVIAHSEEEALGFALMRCREAYPPEDGYYSHQAGSVALLSEELIRAAYASISDKT